MIRVAFHHLLSTSAAQTPDSLALTYKQDFVTYAEVWQRTRGEAAQLLGLGLQPGDRVAIYLEKRLETVVAMFGASAAGGVFVPINHVLKPLQVGHILANSGARVLNTTTDRLSQLAPALSGSGVEHVVVVGSPPAAPPPGVVVHKWTDEYGSTLVDEGDAKIDIDPAAILYISGSTGKPKGVVLRNGSRAHPATGSPRRCSSRSSMACPAAVISSSASTTATFQTSRSALPALRERGLRATFFARAGRLDDSVDRRPSPHARPLSVRCGPCSRWR
jgi:acyl-CoA synthetase (AMP-forming)/AMP-acid ligase II